MAIRISIASAGEGGLSCIISRMKAHELDFVTKALTRGGRGKS
jgi:hypothetical protein